MPTLELVSVLDHGAPEVWARVTTPEGIRDEMFPVLRMTMPPGLRGRSIDDVGDRLGEPLGKAWLFLAGVLPVDYDDMTIVALEPGRAFHERSSMLLLSRWEHRRSVEPTAEGGCRVVDRLMFSGRRRWVEPVALRVVRLLFEHRHRRLRRWDQR